MIFDVNGTLTDMSPLGGRLADVGLSESDLPTWFAGTLRDGFALAVSGRNAGFGEVAGATLGSMLAGAGTAAGEVDAAVRHVLTGFEALPLHPDVEPGLRILHQAGIRTAVLTNGSAQVTTAMLSNAGVDSLVDRVLSVAQAPAWKPAPPAYRYGLHELDLPAATVVLAAAHPWDVDGATRSGLRAVLVQRGAGGTYPPYFAPPELTVGGVDEFAALLVEAA